MAVVAGKFNVGIAGSLWSVEGKADLLPERVEREAVTGRDGVVSFRETPVPAAVEFDFIAAPEILLESLYDAKAVSLTIQEENGRSWVMPEATKVGRSTLSLVTGTIDPVRLEGPELVQTSTA